MSAIFLWAGRHHLDELANKVVANVDMFGAAVILEFFRWRDGPDVINIKGDGEDVRGNEGRRTMPFK